MRDAEPGARSHGGYGQVSAGLGFTYPGHPVVWMGSRVQEIEPDDYRGRAVTFRSDLRTTDVADRAGLVLRIPRHGRRPAPPDPWHDPENHFAPVTGTRDWTRHEVTAQVPAGAISIIFGVFLNGRGQIELRNPQLDPHPANH